MKTNKEIRREKLMNKPGKLGALWSEWLADWRNARDAFRKISTATPARLLPGGGWDRCVRIWDDFDRIIEHMEKSANGLHERPGATTQKDTNAK